jgi:glycosyltransferase involved in cell wall biosynthesis
VEPTVYCPSDGPLRADYEARGIDVITSHPHERTRTIVKLLERRYAEVKQFFLALVESGRFDIVLCNTAKSLCFSAWAFEAGFPSVCIVRESSTEHVHLTFAQGRVIEDSIRALRSTDTLVFVAKRTRDAWAQANSLAPTVVIPNGIDFAAWSGAEGKDVSAMARAQLRQHVGEGVSLSPDNVVFLSVGTVSARKGQRDIIEAFVELPNELRKQAYLVLVGGRDGDHLDAIRARVNGLPPETRRRILIVPETKNVAPWYRAADVFVLASYNESFPRVVMEAMYFGLPIICSDVFGTREQVDEGVNGDFFAPGDVIALRRLMERYLTDPARRVSFGKRSPLRLWELTTYPEMLHRYRILIDKALGRHRRLRSWESNDRTQQSEFRS